MSSVSILKSPKSNKTQEKIKETYIYLLNSKDWDKISVKEICTCANISRGTFYQYFSDIYDVIEQIETPLLEELKSGFDKNFSSPYSTECIRILDRNLYYEPPRPLIYWLDFCKKNQTTIQVMLGGHGDPYFLTRIKDILKDYINRMMDNDHMPHDEMRFHFLKTYTELHIFTVKTWLNPKQEDFLPIDTIIHLLNATRVGSFTIGLIDQQ
jgi:AcrR family transcriptional regulator